MSANPVEAGRKGGRSRSEKKLAAARRNGFQKVYLDNEVCANLRRAGFIEDAPRASQPAILIPHSQEEVE